MLAGLFPAQRAFVESAARYIANHTGRRGGKTHALDARAVRAAARHPKRTIPVIERTQTCAAARVFWKSLEDINDRYRLGMRFHRSLYIATLTNGSEIVVMGADTVESADKIRGGAYPEVIVDETGTFRFHILEYLINEVLRPALFDHQGTLVLSGTPSPRAAGPCYDACKVAAAGFEVHHWTALDNVHIPHDRPAPLPPYSDEERAALRLQKFEEEVAALGGRENPFVQREYYGLWVDDSSRLAYRLGIANYRGVQAPEDLFTNRTDYVWGLGIDLGHNDPSAFVVVARHRKTGILYVVESYEQAGLIPSAVAAHVERLRAQYRPSYIVADTGGYGKGPVAEMMSSRYNIPIIAANKRGKEAHRTFVNGDLLSNRVRIVESTNRDLIEDLLQLRVDPETGDEDERDANHLPDAFLYILTHLAGVDFGLGKPDAPLPGSPAYLAKLEAACEALAAKRAASAASETDEGLAFLPYT